MITLSDGANTIYTTFYEKSVLALPYYLIVFVNDNTGRKVACTATDLSTNIPRYNKFTITVKTTPNPLNGEVELDDYGFYHYYAFEKTAAQIAAFNYAGIDTVDISTITGEVEVGKMKYLTTDPNYAYYKDQRTSVKSYGR